MSHFEVVVPLTSIFDDEEKIQNFKRLYWGSLCNGGTKSELPWKILTALTQIVWEHSFTSGKGFGIQKVSLVFWLKSCSNLSIIKNCHVQNSLKLGPDSNSESQYYSISTERSLARSNLLRSTQWFRILNVPAFLWTNIFSTWGHLQNTQHD